MTFTLVYGVFSVLGVLAFFGGIALLMVIDGRNKTRVRQLEHAERMKSLESGQPLPDAEVARAKTAAQRAWAAGLTALCVPLGLGGIAVAGSALIFHMAAAHAQVPLLCVIWGICGVVGLVATTTALGVLAADRGKTAGTREEAAPAETSPRTGDALVTAFRAGERVP